VHIPKTRESFYSRAAIEIKSPHHAQQLGISTIYQEFNLALHLTVPENIFLGHLPMQGPLVDWVAAKAKAEVVLASLGVTLPMDVPALNLSVLNNNSSKLPSFGAKCRVLIMDEPSAVLGDKDLEKLFKVMRSLKDQGISIIYISHRLVEIFEIADRVTVLKDGAWWGRGMCLT